MILAQCNDPVLLPVLSVMKNVFIMIQIIGPVLSIVALTYLMFKLLMNPEDKQDKIKHSIRNSIIALIVLFLVPMLVNLTMALLGDTFSVSSCWNSADGYKLSSSKYNNTNDKNKTKVIGGKKYDDGGTGSTDNGSSSTSVSASAKEILEAAKVQAEWMKNYTYQWESKPTVEKSRIRGTCVTFVACVLQRVGALQPGKYIWHNGKGYGTGKVSGATSAMTVMYMNNKTFPEIKSQIQAGDVMMVDDNKSGESGNGGHIFIFTGDWDSNGNPIIYDNHSAERLRKGKSARYGYNKNRKVLAVVRMKS